MHLIGRLSSSLIGATSLAVVAMTMPLAKTADVVGDCCADLEERVAELEATAALKGNRKLSLTVSGYVNKIVMWWDDGRSSKTYYGVESGNEGSRIVFSGQAKVTPNVNADFPARSPRSILPASASLPIPL
jgi:hypothetical protein